MAAAAFFASWLLLLLLLQHQPAETEITITVVVFCRIRDKDANISILSQNFSFHLLNYFIPVSLGHARLQIARRDHNCSIFYSRHLKFYLRIIPGRIYVLSEEH